MTNDNFDVAAFHATLDSHRHAMGMSWKDVADQTKVSASTLTRMSQGKKPDVDGLAALLRWSGLDAKLFIRDYQGKTKTESLAQITAVLRADKTLSRESAEAVEEILRAAYNRFRERKK